VVSAWGIYRGAGAGLLTAWGLDTGAGAGLLTAWGLDTGAGAGLLTAWGLDTGAGAGLLTAWGLDTGAGAATVDTAAAVAVTSVGAELAIPVTADARALAAAFGAPKQSRTRLTANAAGEILFTPYHKRVNAFDK
jgi:hypothetical protein